LVPDSVAEREKTLLPKARQDARLNDVRLKQLQIFFEESPRLGKDNQGQRGLVNAGVGVHFLEVFGDSPRALKGGGFSFRTLHSAPRELH
jgi:hypothetical protein